MTGVLTVDNELDAIEDAAPGAARTGTADAGLVSSVADRARALCKRYESVIVAVTLVVVIARVGGEGFRFSTDRLGDAPRVTPFTETPIVASPPVPGPTATPGVGGPNPFGTLLTLPPVVDGTGPAPGGGGTAPTTTTTSPPPAFADGGELGEAHELAVVPSPGAPSGVAVAPDGSVWVSTDNGGGRGADGAPKLFHFAADGRLRATHEIEGVTAGITALRFAPNGLLFAATRSPAAVYGIDPASGASTQYATIPDVPQCVPALVAENCDGSPVDQPPLPMALAFDTSGALFVADANQGAIWRVPPTTGAGTAAQWTVQSTWTNPTRDAGPAGLAFDGAGNLVVVVRSLLTEDVGAVFLLDVGDDGSAGAVQELARTGAASRPEGVALGVSGRLYISLSGADKVLVLDAEGEELERTPTGVIDTPVGLAFRGTSVLAAAQAPGTPDAGRVVRLPTGERGGG